jgi:hypothetical protein
MPWHRIVPTYLIGLLVLCTPVVTIAPSTVETLFETRDSNQLEMAKRAIERFQDAGLDLPNLLIRFPGLGSPDCKGIQGRSYLTREPIEVRICWDSAFILLHELAHVWEAENVSENQRETFMTMRDGVEDWASTDVVWGARGREHAANVVAWGLLEDPYPISTTYPNDVESLTEAFTFLTGVNPLHGGGDGIRYPDRSLFEGTNAPLDSGR